MQPTGKSAARAGALAGALVLGLPLLLFAGGTEDPDPRSLCAPAAPGTLAQHASGPDSVRGGPHIDMPLAEADAAPPVPPETIRPGPWTYPVPAPATITARFAQDGPNWSSRHTGTDWAAPAGTPVMAATPGVVLAVRSAVDGHPFGTFVTVLHHDSVVTVYAHLRDAHVTRGQSVDSGQQLGTVGSTGNSTGPHLHFEVRPQIGGRHLPVDPEPYLAGAAIPAAGPQLVPVADCLPLDTAASAALPDLAHQMHPTLARLTADCPGLPAAWLTAQVMAESSWQPTAWTADSNGGAGGLLQMSRQAWEAIEGSTGSWPHGARPPADHPVWEPATHLRVAATSVCRNLQQMTAHLAQHPQKSITALEASAVCHVAGCSRVTDSAAGIPVPGEARCGPTCVDTIHTYLENINRHLETSG